MLPRAGRLTRGRQITTVTRQGARAGVKDTVTVHLLTPDAAGAAPVPGPAPVVAATPPRTQVAVVVGKGAGGAVTRNRAKRRLRHQVAPLLAALPAGSAVVVRGGPLAATLPAAELAAAVRTSLGTAARRAERPR